MEARLRGNMKKFFFSNAAIDRLIEEASTSTLKDFDEFLCWELENREDSRKARRQMRHLELENLASRSFGELSGGQQQRVLIARALCATESLLILDEPVTGLDPAVTRELYEILEKLNKKEHTAIVMVTHDIAGALPYADKVLHIGPQGYFFGTRREYCASEEGKRMLGTAFREEEEK